MDEEMKINEIFLSMKHKILFPLDIFLWNYRLTKSYPCTTHYAIFIRLMLPNYLDKIMILVTINLSDIKDSKHYKNIYYFNILFHFVFSTLLHLIVKLVKLIKCPLIKCIKVKRRKAKSDSNPDRYLQEPRCRGLQGRQHEAQREIPVWLKAPT